MEAHKRIGSSGPAHVRSSEENKKFYKDIKKKVAKGRIKVNNYQKAAPEYIREK